MCGGGNKATLSHNQGYPSQIWEDVGISLASETQALLLEVSRPCLGFQMDGAYPVESELSESGLASEIGRTF